MGRSISTVAAPAEAVKSIQTGVVNTVTTVSGSGNDVYYYDVTINSVDTNKSVIQVIGGTGSNTGGTVSYGTSYMVFGRLTSSTNLRLFCVSGSTKLSASWTVTEYY